MYFSLQRFASVQEICTNIIRFFQRKLTSFEELERIEDKIRDIENYKVETEQRQKRVVGRLVVYSVGVYVLAAAVFYFLFFPASLRDRLFYIVPLLIFPIIVLLTKRIISWYYVRRMSHQQDLLRRLRSDKRQLLEKVMEKETYKVARTILEKFAPDQLRNNGKTTNQLTVKPVLNSSPSASTAVVPVTNNAIVSRPLSTTITPSQDCQLRHRTNNLIPLQALPPAPSVQSLQPVLPRIRPVLPKESGILDRLIETLVGDGPSWRYALICTKCYGHNGMALREEYPFLAFRCCYCSYYNQAKKQRPLSPRLLDKEDEKHEASSDSDPDSEPQTSNNDETQVESKDCLNESDTNTAQSSAESKEAGNELEQRPKNTSESEIDEEPNTTCYPSTIDNNQSKVD